MLDILIHISCVFSCEYSEIVIILRTYASLRHGLKGGLGCTIPALVHIRSWTKEITNPIWSVRPPRSVHERHPQ